MIVQLYAVADRISGVFDGPHKAINEGQFLRSFADGLSDPATPMSKHPEDFYAVHLGSYNDATGDVVPREDGPKRICDATDFVRPLNDEEK